MKEYESLRLVKGEDLNHHGTLFAARGAAWLVEAAFAAAALFCQTSEGIVCRNLHHMAFKRPVKPGGLVRFASRVVYTGKTSFMVSVIAEDVLEQKTAIEGMVTFVTIKEDTGEKKEHGLVLDAPEDERETALRKRALALRKQQV